MYDDHQQTMIKKRVSGFSLLAKILLMVVYRTLLLALVFFLGHLAYMVHWSLGILAAFLSFAFLIRFWSPSKVLDGSEISRLKS
jgi:hypothetical protein